MHNNNTNKKRNSFIRTAVIIALVGNLILAILKILGGVLFKSDALLGDGIDSSADVAVAVVQLVVVAIISKPADAKHPWGHARAESIATVLLSFVIFFAGAQLAVNSSISLFSFDERVMPSALAIVFTLVSIAGKLLIAISQITIGKRAHSTMLKANGKNMIGDIFISLGVLVGLLISFAIGTAVADDIIAILIGIWIIRIAITIFLEVNLELMDGNSDKKAYKQLFDAVNSVKGASNPHRAKMRKIGGFWDIVLDINVNPNITVWQAHNIATEVEHAIKEQLENVFDVVIHVEPVGDLTKEGFGLSEEDV
jgi:cation diffusion facilitator family transporter